MILLSNMTQFNQMTELWIFVLYPNRVDPQKSALYLNVKKMETPYLMLEEMNHPQLSTSVQRDIKIRNINVENINHSQ